MLHDVLCAQAISQWYRLNEIGLSQWHFLIPPAMTNLHHVQRKQPKVTITLPSPNEKNRHSHHTLEYILCIANVPAFIHITTLHFVPIAGSNYQSQCTSSYLVLQYLVT